MNMAIKQDEETGTSPDELARYDQTVAELRDQGVASNIGVDNTDDLKSAEESAQGPADEWGVDLSGKDSLKENVLRRKGMAPAIVALVGTIISGALGIMVALQTGVESFLMGGLSDVNDNTSKTMERRLNHQLVKDIAKGGNPKATESTLAIRDKMDTISQHTLDRLEKRGVKPIFKDGQAPKPGAKPTHNPTHYEIDMGPGKKPRTLTKSAKEMPSFLLDKNNREVAGRVLGGKRGIKNLGTQAWRGKTASKFYREIGVAKDGRFLRGGILGKSLTDRVSSWAREKVPGIKQVDASLEKLQGKVTKQLRGGRKAGVAYMVALGGCIAVKMPGFVASSYAKVQLAQAITVLMDVVLTPGSMARGAFYEEYTQDNKDTVGRYLTKRVYSSDEERSVAHGKAAKSALESAYLLAALGIGDNKLPVPEDLSPGYKVLTSPLVLGPNALDKNEMWRSMCNTIMSPTAIYTAIAANMAINIVSEMSIVGPLLNTAATLMVTEVAIATTKHVLQDTLTTILEDLMTNDNIVKAIENGGEDAGTVMGIAARAFFNAGGMARYENVLSMSAVSENAAMMQEVRDFEKEVDIATLSPFDISSKYTFLGSIVHNTRMAALAGGYYGNGLSSVISSILNLPATSFGLISNDTAQAATKLSITQCSYAEEWGLDTGDPDTTPAITVAGVPCVGLTREQDAMDRDEALQIMIDEGWVDEHKEIGENDGLDDLVANGVIKPNTPLTDFMESCGDPGSGMYLLNASGCIVSKTPHIRDEDPLDNDLNIQCFEWDNPDTGEKERKCAYDEAAESDNYENDDYIEDMPGITNKRSLLAIPVFLLDYQVATIMRDEDKNVGNEQLPIGYDYGGECPGQELGIENVPLNLGLEKKSGTEKNITLCAIPDTTASIIGEWKKKEYRGSSSLGIDKLVVNAEAALSLYELAKKYKEETGKVLQGSIGYRSVFEQCSFFKGGRNSPSKNQEDLYTKYCEPNESWLNYPGGSWTTNVIASNHGLGYSIDIVDGGAKSWIKRCLSGSGSGNDGKNDNRCYGFWDDVWQTQHWDAGHFTYSPKGS